MVMTGVMVGPGCGWRVRLRGHLETLRLMTRGLLRRLVTRIYFPDEPANAADFALNQVQPARRGTLIARKSSGQSGALEWNVILQGAEETVFFDC